jgi:hypothetical protein
MNFLHRSAVLVLPLLCLTIVQTAMAQQPQPAQPADPPKSVTAGDPKVDIVQAPPDKRVFGVLPNYRTANMTAEYHPITPKQKLTIAVKDTFDYPLMGVAAFYASLYQLEDSHPQFNQGLKGYARRLGTSYTDQVTGNMLSEGILPTLFHEDPRYFRLGEGTISHRVTYALTRIFVTRTDSGGKSFNFAEVIGNGTSAGISLSYYSDSRDVKDYLQIWGSSLATDAISQVLKELWPDVKRKYFHRNKSAAPLAASPSN